METGAILVKIRQSSGKGMPGIQVINERPSGLIHRLQMRGVTDIRKTVSVLYGLCPIAHLCAMDLAERAVKGLSEEDRKRRDGALLERAVALEAVIENLRVFLTDGAMLAGITLDNTALRALGKLRATLMLVLAALVVNKNTPETVSHTHELITGAAAECGALFKDALLGTDARTFYSEVSAESLRKLTDSGSLPAAALLREFDALPSGFGEVGTELMPALNGPGGRAMAEELYSRLKFEPHFDMMPILNDSPQLTGAIVRQHSHPLLESVLGDEAPGPFTLTLARLLDTAGLIIALGQSAPGAQATEPVCPLPAFVSLKFPHSGGVGLVETARGLLTHARGFVPSAASAESASFYAVTSPTEWQFAPEGPATQALQNAFRAQCRKAETAQSPEAIARTARIALFGLDACVPVKLVVNGVPTPMR